MLCELDKELAKFYWSSKIFEETVPLSFHAPPNKKKVNASLSQKSKIPERFMINTTHYSPLVRAQSKVTHKVRQTFLFAQVSCNFSMASTRTSHIRDQEQVMP